MADPSNLGTGVFTATANVTPLEKDMQKLLADLKKFNKELETDFKRSGEAVSGGSKSMAAGLLQASYAIDDLQYGFKSVVNNIPQLVMGLGGSAGIAGAVGVLAVGANVAMNHWQELNDVFGRTAPIEAAKGALVLLQEEIKKTTKEQSAFLDAQLPGGIIPVSLRDIQNYIDKWNDATKAAERHQEALEKIAQAVKQVEGVKGKEATEKGKTFKEAMEAYGGGTKLLEDTTKLRAAQAGITDPAVFENLKKTIAKQIASGMEGGDVKLETLAPRFGEVIQNQKAEREAVANRKAQAQMDEVKKKESDALKHQLHERLEGEKTARMQSLEDQRKKILKDQDAFDEQMWKQQHDKARPSQIIQGAKASLDLYQQAAGGESAKALAEKAHAQRVETNKKLQKIADAMEKERRLVIPR